MSNCEVSGVKAQNIPPIWASVGPLVERALPYTNGLYEVEDILQALLTGKMQLWIVVNEGRTVQGCAITEFSLYPRGLVCRVVLAAGDGVKDWAHLLTEIEQWAFEEGATQLHAWGRYGWKHWAKEHGYESQTVLWTKELLVDKSLLQ